MTIRRHFTAVPDIESNSGLSPWQIEYMKAMKKNVDLMSGFQGSTFQAIVRGDVTVNGVDSQGITGAFDAADHTRVATEVILLRRALNELIDNIN